MIPARKFPLGQQLVWRMIERSLRTHFDRIFFRMHGEQSEEQRGLPIIICANHSSWWDGYIAAVVERQLGLDTYLMMEEAQLRRYFFFAWIGCFSVDRHNARSAMHSLHYAAKLLKECPGRIIWLFPQGEISPNDYRPLRFFDGASYLARMTCPVLIYPLASRIEYLAEQRPDLFISLGEPLLINAEEAHAPSYLKNNTRHLEELVTAELDQLHNDVVASDHTRFRVVIQGKSSTNRIFDTFFLRKQIRRQ